MTIDYAVPSNGPKVEPWSASAFQVQKNGARYYSDQMPPCALIPDPHTDPVPGFSSLKPSKPFRKSVMVGDRKYTVPLDWYRAGEFFADNVLDLKYEQDAHRFYSSVHVQRDRDFARGHAIHQAAEDVLNGKPITNTNPDAAPYIPHLAKWLEQNVTDVHAVEAVVFGDGYGGTGDAWLNIRGVSCYVDWKSRGADSAHQIYPEEIAQGGAYTSARYCILPSDDRTTAVRAPIPAATYGLVLSLKPDGVAEYWYELEGATSAFRAMHEAYTYTSWSGKNARAAKIKDPTSTIETAKRKGRAVGVLTTDREVTPEQAEQIKAAWKAPSEGATVDTVADIRTAYDALDEAGRTWVNAKRAEALAAGYDIHLSVKTERRAAIMTGLVALASAGAGDDELAIILEPHAPTVGLLDHTLAAEFAAACNRYVGTPATPERVAELFGATTEGAA